MGCADSKLLSWICAVTSALGLWTGGCAKSEDPPNNGQSHWLQSCENDADCGALSCECGVCTIACTHDDACDAIPGIGCRSASTLATADACEGDPESTFLCLSAELAPAPDAALSDANSPDAEPLDGAGEAADTGDAEMPSEPTALHVACDTLDALPPGIELVQTASDTNFGNLTASGSGVAWVDFEGTHYRLGASSVETLAEGRNGVWLEGTELFLYSRGTISRRSLESGEVIELAFEPSVTQIRALMPFGDAVYWAAQDAGGGELQRIWRSEREPGATQEIGAFQAFESPYALAVLGEHVYFARASGGGNIAHSVARAYVDGSAPVETLGEPFDGLANIISDGTSLFGTISPLDSDEGPAPDAHRVVRIATDGAVTTLFETTKIWWYPTFNFIAVDDTYLYWIGRSSRGTTGTEQSIWRARKDGRGDPARLVGGFPDGETYLALGDSKLYFAIFCAPGWRVLGADKLD